ncbi:MAG: acyl-CoA thioesterase [Alphaproteobacteria bacterium]|nr:acyl-CoA thioesterase [Alphaproteobacteria bacterium]
MSWQTQIDVEFQHCDPAGIVFYPRYFEMINSVIERYFHDHLSYDFATMHFVDKNGVPTVKIDAEFRAPSRLGDRLTFDLAVERVGNSSLELLIRASCDAQPRMTVRSTLVRIDLGSGNSAPWPKPLADKLRQT